MLVWWDDVTGKDLWFVSQFAHSLVEPPGQLFKLPDPPSLLLFFFLICQVRNNGSVGRNT